MLELGLGNVIAVMIVSVGFYLLFEYPFRRLLELSVLRFCSHDDLLNLTHIRRKIGLGSIRDEIGSHRSTEKDSLDSSSHTKSRKDSANQFGRQSFD